MVKFIGDLGMRRPSKLRYVLSMAVFAAAQLTFSTQASAKLSVVATTSDMQALVVAVANDLVEISSLAKGTQDPHFLEAKPSFMVKMSRADLIVANGLALESAWLPALLRGARNPKVMLGNPGYLELGSTVEPLDVSTKKLTRADGDVHPEGNPHFTLDPIRLGDAAVTLAERLGQLDASQKEVFKKNALAFKARLQEKTKLWSQQLQKASVKKVVTYHSSLNYFLKRFELEAAGYLEPKPGIPPSAQHILNLINTMKSQKVRLILVDNFFDTKIADRVASEVSEAKVRVVGISVGSEPHLKTSIDVYDQLVKAIAGAP